MKQTNGIYHVSYQVGDWLLHCLKLQLLWFYWVFRDIFRYFSCHRYDYQAFSIASKGTTSL